MSLPELSPIEQHVVLLAARGQTNDVIAQRLSVSVKTVEWHLARAARKLEYAAALHDRVRSLPGTENQ